MDPGFSGALQLTDLDDFIGPSQACVKPVQLHKDENASESSFEIKLEDDGSVSQIRDGVEKKLEKTQITLTDCLACSGCVTSAESVLITQQSTDEFLQQARSGKALASMAVRLGQGTAEVEERLRALLHDHVGATYLFNTTSSRDISLLECAAEFLERFRAWKAWRESGAAPGKADAAASASSSRRRRKRDESDSGDTTGEVSEDTEGEQRVASPPLPTEERGTFQGRALPMLASACPGWVCYAEKAQGDVVLPYIDTTRSPQQIMGVLVKQCIAKELNVRGSDIYHVSIMPCYDKKLEASRSEYANELQQSRDVDCVITSSEVIGDLLPALGLSESAFASHKREPPSDLERLLGNCSLEGKRFSSDGVSGGYADYVFRRAARELFDTEVSGVLEYKKLQNSDMDEIKLVKDGKDARAMLENVNARLREDYEFSDPASSPAVSFAYKALGCTGVASPGAVSAFHTSYNAVKDSEFDPLSIRW